MKIAAVYRTVTQSIIAELEQGAAPWVKPWKGGGRIGIMPANAVTVVERKTRMISLTILFMLQQWPNATCPWPSLEKLGASLLK